MVYKKFYFNIIFRIIILFLTSLWLSFSLQEPEKIYTIITIGSVIIIQIVSLINYINKTNRELSRFFASLKDKDSSIQIRFDENKGVFKELASTLNEVADLIGQSRIESEKSSKYFEFVVEHIPIGLLTINKSDHIIHSNNALKRLLNCESLNTISKIKTISLDLYHEILNIKPGDQKVIRIKLQNHFIQILIRSTQFKFNNEFLKLISFQDVKNELEENELVSWQKLIRILTHEIMNSITPISTLTLAINKCLTIDGKAGTIENLRNDHIIDALTNTELIEERTKGLEEFVTKYRSLTHVRALKIEQINLSSLVNNTTLLFKDTIDKLDIKLIMEISPDDLIIEADNKLIEQVMINLIKNAIESVSFKNDRKININAKPDSDNRTKICITDNGPGIPDDIIDQIFMPFFTTKEQGSGIGLSLARQIMRLHGGNISVTSDSSETTFILQF